MANGSSFVSKTAYSEQKLAIETQKSAIEISSLYESVQGLAWRMRADHVAVEHIAGSKGAYLMVETRGLHVSTTK